MAVSLTSQSSRSSSFSHPTSMTYLTSARSRPSTILPDSHSATSCRSRPLPRSPSDPLVPTSHDSSQELGRGNEDANGLDSIPLPPPPPQRIYVLAADGSRLYLVDASKPRINEEPPPYAPFRPPSPQSPHALSSSSNNSILNSTHAGHRVMSSSPNRHRASTLSSFQPPHPNLYSLNVHPNSTSPRARRPGSSIHSTRTRSRTSLSSSAYSPIPNETTPLLFSPPVRSPGRHSLHLGNDEGGGDTDEEMEVRGGSQEGPKASIFKSICLGEIDEGSGKRRYWTPIIGAEYWKSVFHLLILNFPFALFVWPPLLVGTLVGTVLLITLPLGATVWWLTLIIARFAARVETIMQIQHHSPIKSMSTYHPIFYRIKTSPSPVPSTISSTTHGPEIPPSNVQWERRFLHCSWAMFCDHYSYSALSYFLLIKPIITLFPWIALLALFPITLVFFPLLPVYLRAARRWGQWQAHVAMVNL